MSILRTFLLAALATPALAAESAPTKLDSNLPYQAERSNPITHAVDFSVVITPPAKCQVLKVWLPLPSSDAGQEVANSRLSAFPDPVAIQVAQAPVYGDRLAYLEYHKPQGAQIIRHRFTAKVWELRWNVDPRKVTLSDEWPDDFQRYLKPHPLANEARFVQTLRQLTPSGGGLALGLFKAMDWIDANLTYDHADASLRADPLNAWTKLRGHCSDYHGLCATMGRALGCPTRVTYGLSLFPKNSPSHCKMEAYLPPYGWVSFDLSETQKLVQTIRSGGSLSDAEKLRLTTAAQRRLESGFRENSWIVVTRGTNYELAPKASRPVPVVRTIYAEADGEPLPEPDPANPEKREFAWMTVHKYTADKPFKLPFKDWSTLAQDAE